MSILTIEDLNVALPFQGKMVPIVDGVSLQVQRGKVLGIAGESGSGKTVSAMTVMGLLPKTAKISGSIDYNNTELLGLSEHKLQQIRGEEIAMIFQDPLSSLHPMLTIGEQLTDHVRYHNKVSKKEAKARAIELLEMVRLPNPTKTIKGYPHQLSGGMRQRVAIAIALACNPSVLIADEPTTALDVTVQAGIIELLKKLTQEQNLAVMIVTHDLGVLSSIADDLVIFYAGRIVESSSAKEVFQNPQHPYTQALLAAIPHQDPSDPKKIELKPMRGSPPGVGEWPQGCSFNPRCDVAIDQCTVFEPSLLPVAPQHEVACLVRTGEADS